MCSDLVISVENVSKCYAIYNKPIDRLKQFFLKSRKLYEEFWAVRDVSFRVYKGETVGIIGKNGSGKSTLLQMICGTVTPTFGQITVQGRIAALLELGAGFNTEFTGIENVFLNAEILGISRSTMRARLPEILDFSELGDKLYQPVKTYSSGMFARLAFSVAIHVDPDILIVDEALAVGDARFVAKCMKKIKELQSRGVSILFVSHDVGSVRTLCDRVIWVNEGEKIADGDVFPITGKYMEFMFHDDGESEGHYESDFDNESILLDVSGCDNELVNDFSEFDNLPSTKGLDERPVTHWGSHKGLIRSAMVLNSDNRKVDCIKYGEEILIRLDLSIPIDICRKDLNIAFSIKDLKGSDLIVATNAEAQIEIPLIEDFSFEFRLKNELVDGKYLLVATVERRGSSSDVHYLEYIEGAQYFSSLANKHYFGIFRPEIDQKLIG